MALIARKPTRKRQGILETNRRHPRRYEPTAARDTNSTIRAFGAALSRMEVFRRSSVGDRLARGDFVTGIKET